MGSLRWILLVALLPGSIVLAQERQLSVQGESTVTANADRAEMSFTIEKKGKDLEEAFAEAQATMSQIYSDLLAIGCDSSILQPSRVRVDDRSLHFVTSEGKAVHRAKVVLRKLDLLEPLLQVLGRYDIEQSSRIRFVLADETTLRQKAYVAALDDARRTAEALAKSAGLSLGTIVSVEERLCDRDGDGDSEGRSYYMDFRGEYIPPVMADQIAVTKTLKVTFAMK